MGLRSAFIVAAVATLFVLQGVSFLRRAGRHKHLFGALTIVLAGLGLLCYLLLVTGTLVSSPEFRVVMAEGPLARWGLILVILAAATGGGLAWHTARLARRRRSAGWKVAGAGFAVGLWAVWRLRALTPNDPAPFRIYSYDLWWPPLLVWLTLCAGGVITTLLLSRLVSRQAWTAAVPASVFGLLALERPEFSDPTSRRLWVLALQVLLCGNAAWATRLAYPLFRRRLVLPPRWETRGRVGFPAAVAVAGLVLSSALLWGGGGSWALRSPVWGLWLLWTVWPGVIVVVTIVSLYSAKKSGKLAWPHWRRPNVRQVGAILAAAAILLGMMDLFFVFQYEPATTVTLLLVAWLLLIEALDAGAVTMASSGLAAAGRTSLAIQGSLLGAARRLTARGTPPARAAESWPGAVVKTLLGVLLLIVLSELPHAGKTVIQPFGSNKNDPDQKEHPDLGALVTAQVVNGVGKLREEMQPEVLLVRPHSKRDDAVHTRFVPAESTGASATVGRESVLELGPVKIPVDLLVAPIQQPIRAVIGSRTVRGVVQHHGQAYTLLATSTDGDTWSVAFPSAQRPHLDPSTAAPTPAASPPDLSEAVKELAGELAFKMIASDPGMVSAGITRSWQAFRRFRDGLADWERAKSDINALQDAIQHFRQAIEIDHDFALAHYRLGLALQVDGQPARAIEAFRTSLRTNPQFAAAYVTLADTLMNFENYYPHAAPGAAPPSPSSVESPRARLEEARILWQRMLRLPSSAVSPYDRASAYLGLCSAAVDSVTEDRQYLSYFYCKRAEGLLGGLPPAVRQAAAILEARVSVWNTLGVGLARTGQVEEIDPWRRWSCSDRSADRVTVSARGPEFTRVLWKSPYGRAARRYYQRALELSPDDITVRCNAASSALGDGDGKPMEALEKVPAAHLRLGEAFMNRAGKATEEQDAAGFYQLALQAYKQAIARDPTLVEALNGYAYTFWQWRYQWPASGSGPEAAVAEEAELNARNALRAAAGGREEIAIQTRSTLGEVLLARGRPHEAIEELERALGGSCSQAHSAEDLANPAGHPCRHVRGSVPGLGRWRHSGFDEIRWDLAQAYLCAASRDQMKRGSLRQESFYARASQLLEQIRSNETEREYRPFSDDPRQLDAARVQNVCASTSKAEDREPAGGGPLFALDGGKVRYESMPVCTWLGVAAEVAEPAADSGAEAAYQLHVWGGGVDRRIDLVAGGAPEDVLLTSRPRATHDYYFAQLEDGGRAVSGVSALQTFANDGPSRCSRNLMRLVYRPASGGGDRATQWEKPPARTKRPLLGSSGNSGKGGPGL